MLPSIFENKITRTTGAIVAVLILFALSSCSKKFTPGDAVKTWDTYVRAMKAGDADSALACFAPESQPYCILTKKEMDWFTTCRFKLLNSRETDNYAVLEFEQTVDGKPWPRSIYFVHEGDRMLMQYPYILFASDWPIATSSHYRFHLDPASVSADDKENNYSATIDTVPFEQYLALLDSLTGLPVQKPIDYYYSPDTTTIAELLGAAKVYRGSLGRMVASWIKNDVRDLAIIPMVYDTGTIQFVGSCVLDYGEVQRAKIDARPGSQQSLNSILARKLAAMTPEHFEATIASDKSYSDSLRLEGWAKMACMIDLLKRHDPHTFCELFDRSNSVAGFKAALSDLYGLTPETWLAELKKEFPVPEQASKN
ncbi:MAG TPA: hypothetical protein VJ983_09555 [candidate division Zixibacteria bacterium]|nr:hypothetical protein [candidate division Zixibacteria bacterium]